MRKFRRFFKQFITRTGIQTSFHFVWLS